MATRSESTPVAAPTPFRDALAAVFLVVVVVVGVDGDRIGDSPIRGSAAWLDGVLIGVMLGAVAAVCWFRLTGNRHPRLRPLAAAAAIATAVTIATASSGSALRAASISTSGRRASPLPPVTDGYRAGAVSYDVIKWSACRRRW